MIKRRTKWILGSVIIGLAAFSLVFLNLKNNIAYYYTPGEVISNPEIYKMPNIRIGAFVKKGSMAWDEARLNVTFVVTDSAGHEIIVEYRGTPPSMFKEGQGVIIEGRFKDNGKTMVANNLIVKHSEEYKKPDAIGATDEKLLRESMLKGEKNN